MPLEVCIIRNEWMPCQLLFLTYMFKNVSCRSFLRRSHEFPNQDIERQSPI